MKKFAIMGVCLLYLLVSSQAVVLTRQFTDELLDHVKITQKPIQKGVVLVITSKDPRVADRVKQIVRDSLRMPQLSGITPNRTLELLRIKAVRKSVVFLNNGVKLGLTSDTPRWVIRIQQLRLEGARKPK